MLIVKKIVISILLSIGLIGCDVAVNAQMDSTYDKVSEDMVAQYNIAKKQGDKMQTCVQAGMVSVAYLQAKDEAKYNEWKEIEKSDCAAAGITK